MNGLVDKKLTDLLKACSLLKYPTMESLKPKMVQFGPKLRQKLLILDMDETMLHTKFEVNINREVQPPNL